MLTVIFLLVGLIGMFFATSGSDVFCAFTACSVISFIVTLIVNGVGRYMQVDNIESIIEHEKVKVILERKAERLVEDCTLWLGEKYPDIEKGIFDKLTPDTISMFAVHYPEIQSAKVLTDLANKIVNLKSQAYREEANIEMYKKMVRVGKRNPWFIPWFIPIQ